MNKKVVIISYYYKHKNAMASVRAIKLAKYLSELGNDITVLTSMQRDTWTGKNNEVSRADDRIHEIYTPENKLWTTIFNYLEKRKKRILSKKCAAAEESKQKEQVIVRRKNIKKFIKSILSLIFCWGLNFIEGKCLLYSWKKQYKKLKDTEYDVVIATYPCAAALLMGKWIKKNGMGKEFIADFRDPLYNPGFKNNAIENRYDLLLQNKILKASDKVVCVSEGIREAIIRYGKLDYKKVFVLPNGFDTDDRHEIVNSKKTDDTVLHIVYTGTLYHGRRCVNMLAEVLQELIEEGYIEKEEFIFEYAGTEEKEFNSQLSSYGLSDRVKHYGFIPRNEAIKLQNSADVLLLLTWNDDNYKGVVPGKLYEYMMTNIPIVALVTGNCKNSEVSEIISSSKIGFACEEADINHKFALKNYISELFNKKRKNQILMESETDIEKYNYKQISKKYMELFD